MVVEGRKQRTNERRDERGGQGGEGGGASGPDQTKAQKQKSACKAFFFLVEMDEGSGRYTGFSEKLSSWSIFVWARRERERGT